MAEQWGVERVRGGENLSVLKKLLSEEVAEMKTTLGNLAQEEIDDTVSGQEIASAMEKIGKTIHGSDDFSMKSVLIKAEKADDQVKRTFAEPQPEWDRVLPHDEAI